MEINYLALFLLVLLFAYFIFRCYEFVFIWLFRRPVYTHLYFRLKSLSVEQESFLSAHFPFYVKLSAKHKRYFQHRLVNFMQKKDFEGRGGLVITDEIRLMVSATAVMLTFGMRDYFLGILRKIIIYPDIFYSYTCGGRHKGEFNPLMEVLVLSWEDFEQGFQNNKDKLNLGIHEFTHVLQVNSERFYALDTSVFLDENQRLEDLLKEKSIRLKLTKTKLFRKYAFTNKFEFLAVMVEGFIESPHEFRHEFPRFYVKIKRMLNFNFAGY